MNEKENILNAWIMVEKLSEGSINLKDQGMRTFDEQVSDWEKMFRDFLKKHKNEEKISDRDYEKSGLGLFFGIFDFKEVVDILREKYHIPVSQEDRTQSKKFTFAIFFDNQLHFYASKFFYTMSGYIRSKKQLPEDIEKEENNFCDNLNGKFKEESFGAVLSMLFEKYAVNLENFRYKFVKNLDKDDVNMHSFFIRDLKRAKDIATDNLNRYFLGCLKNKINLDSKKGSPGFQQEIFENILQPKYYPEGRFLSDSEYALSFMQQVAMNLAINDSNQIRSVNGPPGTGKTTLLKDIFAHILVRQAKSICQLRDKAICESLNYWEQAKIGVLSENIADGNIVVASSNNGAVQNIVNELPQKDNVSKEFYDKLIEVDYFREIANSEIECKYDGKERELNLKKGEEKYWGVFSLEGGALKNVGKLLLVVEAIEKDLEENYQPNEKIYEEFLDLHEKLIAERERVQQCHEKLKKLLQTENGYEKRCIHYKQEKKEKQSQIDNIQTRIERGIENCEKEKEDIQEELNDISREVNILNEKLKQAERNYNLLLLQKPGLLGLQKIFNKTKINQYYDELNDKNRILNDLGDKKTELQEIQDRYKENLKECERKIDGLKQEGQDADNKFKQWIGEQESQLLHLEQRIDELEKEQTLADVKGPDFSLSYEQLQKSNPWFGKEFRVLQTELFIAALKVKKQFLYDNRKNLKKARIIWNKQSEYVSKENGHKIIKAAWQWLNCAVPVISTTFASLGSMFYNLKENSINNLFIDEAGQALPQASVGAIFRSKRVMVVGDPAQIKPVLTLDSPVLTLIGRHFEVSEKFVSASASTQTIVDDASQYGFWKNEEEWIGIPLWVHRRSNYPMFTISNEISYNGLMVQGKTVDKASGKAQWYDVTGAANDKFVQEQAALLIELIGEHIKRDSNLKKEIYVISPFRNVAFKLAKELDKIGFTERKDGKATNVGTVHTFQGKEARIVYLVMGADMASTGAAAWAVSEPNIINVAATRAKEEFYIIGDKKLYASLGSKVANTTMDIIERHNK